MSAAVADCAASERVPSRENSMRVLDLAMRIADASARDEIEAHAVHLPQGGLDWIDTQRPVVCEVEIATGFDAATRAAYGHRIVNALRYIELRDPDAFPWRFLRHPEQPHLVRFEDRQ